MKLGRAFIRGLAVLALTSMALTSCRGATETKTPNLSFPEQAITGFDPSPSRIEVSFHVLNQLARSRPTEVRQAALKHLGDRDRHVHYAAVYTLALTATPDEGTAQLVAMLTSSDIDERLLSAASLAGAGDKRALPVLIDALDQTDQLSYRDPPQPGFAFARIWLLNLTDQDYGLKAAQDQSSVTATKPAWEQWWSSNQATLQLDKKTGRYAP